MENLITEFPLKKFGIANGSIIGQSALFETFTILNKTKLLRRQRDDSQKVFTCPVTMKDYNTIVGRVDKTNIICSLYGVSRKSEKWWHYIFFFSSRGRTLCKTYVAYKRLINP